MNFLEFALSACKICNRVHEFTNRAFGFWGERKGIYYILKHRL